MGIKDLKQSILTRCIKGPIKILAKARDFYVQNSGVHVFYGGGMSCPTPQLGSLPRSISVGSSTSSYTISSGEYSRPSPMGRWGPEMPVPRCQSGTIGRIDENNCCEFEVTAYPRSRSCAAPRRSKVASGAHDFEMDVKYRRI